jgi:hypothetical protein
MALVARAGVTVVTQPNFIFERGDQYLTEVDPADHEHLYRCRGFLDAAIPLGGSTDAPFGQPDPWLSMRAAVSRQTASGRVIGAAEALTPEQALALFTSAPEDPGGPPRICACSTVAGHRHGHRCITTASPQLSPPGLSRFGVDRRRGCRATRAVV